MPDVFLSHSSRDDAFARRLQAALEDRGKDVWVDYDDIPDAARWADEVKRALEGAGAFVFVISPDAIVSSECGK
jgi:hypothetical protein